MVSELVWLGSGIAGGVLGSAFVRARRAASSARAGAAPLVASQVSPPAVGGENEGVSAPAMDVRDGRFEELFGSLTVGIVTLDRQGHVTSANGAANAILDFGQRAVVGRAMIECVPSFDLDRHVREALEGEAWRGEIALSSPRTRVLTVATLPIRTGAMVIASDETRLHELERTRRDFITNVSHELRTPLSSINLMIETILAARDDDEVLDMFLPRVKYEVDRMIALVQDLLDLARAEPGQIRLRLEPLDLREIAATIVDTFEPRARQAEIALELVVPDTPVTIDGDRDRLAQVLVNLIDNALKHTSSGGEVVLTVGAGEQRARLDVSDTGIGIPYNDLPYLFERFYVVERSRTRGTSGTGLGLSIVKQIVEAHGGRISADSEFGYGATFTVTVPLARAPAPPPVHAALGGRRELLASGERSMDGDRTRSDRDPSDPQHRSSG